MKKMFASLVIVLSLLVVSLPGAVSAAELKTADSPVDRPATVYLVHGIPGQDLGLNPELPVDVLVNDEICLFQEMPFGKIVGPLTMEEGTYNFKISLTGDKACAKEPVIETDVTFYAGESSTVIAHLTEKGQPMATKFVNSSENSITDFGDAKATLAVRHAANAPVVDVNVERLRRGTDNLVIRGLSNGEEGRAEVQQGRYRVTLYAVEEGAFSGANGASIDSHFSYGPVTLSLDGQMDYFVYAVGSAESGSFTLIVQSLAQ